MRKTATRFLIFFLTFACLISTVIPGMKAKSLSEEEISSPSALLMDASSGKILYEKNSREKRACASVTKVMTLLLVMEALDKEQIRLDDVVTASAKAASMGGSDIWLEEGEQMSVNDLIKATAVASANDAAVALAEHINGSVEDFVAAMNEKAKTLSMEDTTFLNCNGLDEEGHLSSARDVALMSRELIRHKKIFDYTSIWMDDLRGGETQIVNTNKLLKTYDGITGLKTGTTSDAGSCISATAERGGLSLIAVTLGAETGTARFKDAAALLDFGFANFETVNFDKKEEIYPLKVEGGMQETVALTCRGLGSITVKKGAAKNLKEQLDIKKSVKAPIKKGEKVGTLSYLDGSDTVASFDVVTAEAVEARSFSALFSLVFDAMKKL